MENHFPIYWRHLSRNILRNFRKKWTNFQRFLLDLAFRISGDFYVERFAFRSSTSIEYSEHHQRKNQTVRSPFFQMERVPVIPYLHYCMLFHNDRRPNCAEVALHLVNYAPLFPYFLAEECYSENTPCWLKSLAFYCARFDNLLAQAFTVSMWININATHSKEIRKMELMTAANYCSACLLRQINSINFCNVSRPLFVQSNKKIYINSLTNMINLTVRDKD